jgi:hypothetical protein
MSRDTLPYLPNMTSPTHFSLLINADLAAVRAPLEAAHKMRYSGSPPTHFSLPLINKELAAAQAHLEATHKMRYGGSPPTHVYPPLTAAEVAKLNAAILDEHHHQQAAALQCHLDEETACQWQDVIRWQQRLLEKYVAHDHQEANYH